MEFRRMGTEVFSTAGGEQDYLKDDPNDPSRRLIRQVLGAVNEYERGMIRLRLRRGRDRKTEKGGYAGGRPPYGYVASGKELVPDAREQEALLLANRLREGGSSLRQIGDELQAQGFRPKAGGAWHPTQVARLVAPVSPRQAGRN